MYKYAPAVAAEAPVADVIATVESVVGTAEPEVVGPCKNTLEVAAATLGSSDAAAVTVIVKVCAVDPCKAPDPPTVAGVILIPYVPAVDGAVIPLP